MAQTLRNKSPSEKGEEPLSADYSNNASSSRPKNATAPRRKIARFPAPRFRKFWSKISRTGRNFESKEKESAHEQQEEEVEDPPVVITASNTTDEIEPKTGVNGHEKHHIQTRLVWSPRAVLAVALYLILGPTLIMLNKYILGSLKFKYPILLAALGMLFSGIIVHGLVFFNRITIRKNVQQVMTWKFFVVRIGILALFQALTLNFGNRVYVHLSVSLIQMLKSFTPVMVMTMLFLFRLDIPTCQLVISIVLLSLGTAITSTGVSGADSSSIGFVYMFLAEFCEAMKLVLTQKLLQGVNAPAATQSHSAEKGASTNSKMDVKFTEFEGLYYYAPTATFWMCVLALPLEIPSLLEEWTTKNAAIVSQYWHLFILAGFLGFGVNISGWMVTGVISSLYLKALAVFRNSCLVLFNVVFLGEIVTAQQFAGYVITLIGFAYYNFLKMN
ncbi:hypothetical protein RFI_15291 [Reticulomyxa filosa]|uniref:Sugar phosphate transporter domain-containing protein n=1 Tax=Reticulomyxa filosa TaxID=46433 RepID=X6N858_RETFI|nr:hypothetical protein RFI_15291 [Reticulomyxa filosa]|eukprot:ETO21914.1 hypothetical protein RFI_15291 [Reticulomyxa filosa]